MMIQFYVRDGCTASSKPENFFSKSTEDEKYSEGEFRSSFKNINLNIMFKHISFGSGC